MEEDLQLKMTEIKKINLLVSIFINWKWLVAWLPNACSIAKIAFPGTSVEIQ